MDCAAAAAANSTRHCDCANADPNDFNPLCKGRRRSSKRLPRHPRAPGAQGFRQQLDRRVDLREESRRRCGQPRPGLRLRPCRRRHRRSAEGSAHGQVSAHRALAPSTGRCRAASSRRMSISSSDPGVKIRACSSRGAAMRKPRRGPGHAASAETKGLRRQRGNLVRQVLLLELPEVNRTLPQEHGADDLHRQGDIGWCYVDPAARPRMTTPGFVAKCPPNQKRIINFVGPKHPGHGRDGAHRVLRRREQRRADREQRRGLVGHDDERRGRAGDRGRQDGG